MSASIHPLALRDAVSDQAAQWLKDRLAKGARLTADSRRVQAGDGFFARHGARGDVAVHIEQALKAGAAAVLVEAPESEDGQMSIAGQSPGVPQLRVPLLARRAGMIASAFYDRPSLRLQLIAVTGTNGKSTVTAALAHALARSGIQSAAIGTLGCAVYPAHCAVDHQPTWRSQDTAGLTTPDPVDLQCLLARLADQAVAAVVIEASSIGLEQARLAGCAIKIAAFTNLSHDHLDLHGSMQAYAAAKALLFSAPSLGAVVINLADAYGLQMWQAVDCHAKRIAIGADPPSLADATLQVRHANNTDSGFELHLAGTGKASGLTARVQLPVHGQHNIENALVVAGCLLGMQIEADEILQRLSEFQLPPGRLQMIRQPGAPLACVDYAHTPDALAHVLNALRPLADRRGGQLTCVFGCGGDRDPAKRPLMGEVAARLADHVVLTSDNPRSEPPEAILQTIANGVPAAQGAKVIQVVQREQAIAQAISQAQASDVILLAGKGHEQTQIIGNTELPFSDADHADRALTAWCQSHGLTQAQTSGAAHA